MSGRVCVKRISSITQVCQRTARTYAEGYYGLASRRRDAVIPSFPSRQELQQAQGRAQNVRGHINFYTVRNTRNSGEENEKQKTLPTTPTHCTQTAVSASKTYETQ